MNLQRFWLVALCLGVTGAIGCPDHRPSPSARRGGNGVPDTTTEQLVVMLSDKDALTRLEAAQRLLTSNPELAAEHNLVAIAVESLSDESYEVRRDATRLLGSASTGEDEVVPALRHALTDEHFEVRTQAVAALGRLALPSGSPVTIGIESYEARSAVGVTTADLLPVVPDLVKLTEDKSVPVRVAAVDALLAIEPEPSGEAIKRISAVVIEVFEVWSPFCMSSQTTTSETAVQAFPFRVEQRTRILNRQGPPTVEDFKRAFADVEMEAPIADTSLLELDIYKQTLTPMGDSLVIWAMTVERRLATRGINLWEQ